MLKIEGQITSVSMDEMNNEGLVGTAQGCIHYINFTEKYVIKLVQKASPFQDKIGLTKFDSPNLFMTCSEQHLKIWATHTVDQVMQFRFGSEVSFVLS